MTRSTTFLVAVTTTILIASVVTAAEGVRVGTYDSRALALAYGRSSRPDGLMAQVDALKAEHAKATAAGDAARVTELEAQGQALQQDMHRKVFGGAPIDDILALIADDLAQIAAAAHVDLIVADVLINPAGVELVDVTFEMAAAFAPDEQTRALMKDVFGQPRVPLSELKDDD